jgi:hypothetical protein
MNNSTQFEDRASSSRGKHEGESSSSLCDRLSRTRDSSQRQLPTDQDYAVSTREYQTDQSSLKTAPTAAGPVLEKQPKQPQSIAGVDRSLHIMESLPPTGRRRPPHLRHLRRLVRTPHRPQNQGTLPEITPPSCFGKSGEGPICPQVSNLQRNCRGSQYHARPQGARPLCCGCGELQPLLHQKLPR